MNQSDYKIQRGYRLDYRQDGVYLQVLSEKDWKYPINLSDVLYYINSKRIKGYDVLVIEEAVKRRDGQFHKIAEMQEEVKLDAVVKVRISPDKMSATIHITPPDGGRMLSFEEVMNILKYEKVVYGINVKLLHDLCRNPAYNKEIVIAEGKTPINGKNGHIDYHFEITKDRTPKILEDGRVNFRELNLIENVHAGDILATITPPVKGIDGMNVMGQKVPAISGKPVIPPKGKNVVVSEDGLILSAAIDGQVVIADKKINVLPFYEVVGNVDSSTGNINFIGNVFVRGNVLTGFTIEAGGTVEVQGVVEGAFIKAGGDIVLRRGMQGGNKGTLIAGKSITARYIENSNISAVEDIRCEVIMHSTVKCGGILELGGKNGLIVGGSAKVGREIHAKVIGSYMETITELEVGMDPIYRERYKALKEELEEFERNILKAEQAISLLTKLEAVNRLDDKKRYLLEKSINTKEYFTEKLKDYQNELEFVEKKLEEEGYGKIKASEVIYPGTRITIGTSMMLVKNPIQFVTLYRDQGDIKIGPYEK